MLRIAIYYENRLGRNDGNPLYIYTALKRREASGELMVTHLVPNGDYKLWGEFDAHIIVDWGEDGLKGLLPYEVDYKFGPGVKIYWASDTHCAEHSYQYRKDMCKWADLSFVAQKTHIPRLIQDGVEDPTWLPHAVEPYAYCDIDAAEFTQGSFVFKTTNPKPYELISKPYDLGFVGHVNNQKRIDALERMFREFPNFYFGQKLFNEAARKYAESKVCFNISMEDDLNMRCFEVMGSKSLLLTDRQSNIEELFQDGKHLVLYNTLDEAVDKARYYIQNQDEARAIANAGYKEVMANHTIDRRVDTMLNKLFEKYPQLKEEKELV